MRTSRWCCGLLALAFALSPACTETTYTVRSGDSLSLIAQRVNVPVSDLVALNHLSNPDVLYVGQHLRLPDSVPPSSALTPTAPKTTPNTVSTPNSTTTTNAAHPLSGRELIDARTEYVRQQQRMQAGQRIVNSALTYAGTRYRWGGLSSRGIDCSGLVVRALGAQGRTVPHNSAALYRLGTPVTYRNLRPGDLVFFNTNGRGISHVGIWMGNNKFVHASSSRGRVVQDELTGGYARQLVGARRLN